MDVTDNILKDALILKPSQKAELIDKLLSSLDKPDREIDELWAKEAEDRIDAYNRGKIKAIPLERMMNSRWTCGKKPGVSSTIVLCAVKQDKNKKLPFSIRKNTSVEKGSI